MTDNGALVLARARAHMVHGHTFCSQCVQRAADLDDIIDRLPDAAELDRLRGIEAAAENLVVAYGKYSGFRLAEVTALRAALQPEGSAGT